MPAVQTAVLTPLLRRLEAEGIEVLREVAAVCERPVLLYSIGKDSAVLLHLAQKAFRPAGLPFPLLHIDTGWKFREMIAFRDATAARTGASLIVHQNAAARAAGVNPFDHGPDYTRQMKTEALKEALRLHDFDAAIGGARRDEERSRAKERVFSVRSAAHGWDPKAQRPEFWHNHNATVPPGGSLRVFPLSNWTELDVWRYVEAERIPVVPLYFAAVRPTVERDHQIIVVDDPARMRFAPGETAVPRKVRFRSLGCWPLTGAVESEAADIAGIVAETESARISERGGRLIDADETASMERKKREGYF